MEIMDIERYMCRGKRTDTYEWIFGTVVKIGENICIIQENADFNNTNCCGEYSKYSVLIYNIIPETLGQATGLKDKHGLLIFEGDILSGKFGQSKDKARVFYRSGGFVFNTFEDDFNKPLQNVFFHDPMADMQTQSFISGTCEVIGNVHDLVLQ